MVSAVGHPDLTQRSRPPGPILLNARAATRPTITGVERWTAEVIARLHHRDPGRYRVVVPPRWARRRLAAQTWEQVALPALARHIGAPLVFSPANLAPLAWPRNVVVMHDAAVLREPEAYSRAYVAWHRRVRADRRPTGSGCHHGFGVLPRRARLAGRPGPGAGACRSRRRQRPLPSRRRSRARCRARLGLHRPYVLTIATADRRKNLGAAEPRRRASGASSGSISSGRATTARTSRPSQPIPGVRALGYVDDADLPALYAGARAFVLPSRYEGFGLTCLEAMACGVPVVAADRAALPETCGDAAVLVDPDDAEVVREALAAVLSDAALRQRLRSAGLARAAQSFVVAHSRAGRMPSSARWWRRALPESAQRLEARAGEQEIALKALAGAAIGHRPHAATRETVPSQVFPYRRPPVPVPGRARRKTPRQERHRWPGGSPSAPRRTPSSPPWTSIFRSTGDVSIATSMQTVQSPDRNGHRAALLQCPETPAAGARRSRAARRSHRQPRRETRTLHQPLRARPPTGVSRLHPSESPYATAPPRPARARSSATSRSGNAGAA